MFHLTVGVFPWTTITCLFQDTLSIVMSSMNFLHSCPSFHPFPCLVIGLYLACLWDYGLVFWLINWSMHTTCGILHFTHCSFSVPIFFLSFTFFCDGYSWFNLIYPWRENLNGKIASTRLAFGHVCVSFSWLLIDMGRPNTLWVVPSMDKWYWQVEER